MLSLSPCRAGLSIFERFSATPTSEQTRLRECLSTHPDSQDRHGVIRWGQRRAAVCVRRGTTARPREAGWSSRLAAAFWVCYNENIFKDPNYYDFTSVLYNKDFIYRSNMISSYCRCTCCSVLLIQQLCLLFAALLPCCTCDVMM